MEETLCGVTAFKLHRVPPQVIGLCPPLSGVSGDHNRREFLSHPVVSEILGAPLHRLVTARCDLSSRKHFRDHLWMAELPLGSIHEHILGINVTSPAMTLLTLATSIPFPQLIMAIYEVCGGFSIFKPTPSLEELLQLIGETAHRNAPAGNGLLQQRGSRRVFGCVRRSLSLKKCDVSQSQFEAVGERLCSKGRRSWLPVHATRRSRCRRACCSGFRGGSVGWASRTSRTTR